MRSGARESEATDVRSQVVVVATRLFAAHGFDGTSLQDIADAVGVSKPAVLHHFASKEHIRTAVLDAIVEHWREALPRLLVAANTADGHQRFAAIYRELQRFFGEHPERARVMVREGLDRPDETRKLLSGPSVRPWLSAIGMYVRSSVESGRSQPDVDPEPYVMLALQLVVFSSAMGSVVGAAIADGPEAEARYFAEVARIARAALFVTPSLAVDPPADAD